MFLLLEHRECKKNVRRGTTHPGHCEGTRALCAPQQCLFCCSWIYIFSSTSPASDSEHTMLPCHSSKQLFTILHIVLITSFKTSLDPGYYNVQNRQEKARAFLLTAGPSRLQQCTVAATLTLRRSNPSSSVSYQSLF